MDFHSLVTKVKDKYNAYQADQARKRAEEEARQQKILTGNIKPITGQFNLNTNEKAYFESEADRMATVTYTIEKTIGSSKNKGTITRSIVGKVLFGVPGMIIGGVTGGSKQESTTIQEHEDRTEAIDTGKLLFTNKRVLFIGEKNVISIPYGEILSFTYNWAHEAVFKYPSMLNGEFYQMREKNRKDLELYYKGITDNIFHT